MNKRKLLHKLLSGSKKVRFDDLVVLAEAFGFTLSRINGSHHIFVHPDISEQLNLQKVKGKAKPYQIRQLPKLVEEHDLELED